MQSTFGVVDAGITKVEILDAYCLSIMTPIYRRIIFSVFMQNHIY